jgi:EamA domain-containing membrane protein RarD
MKNLLLKIVNPVLLVLLGLQILTGALAGTVSFTMPLHRVLWMVLLCTALVHLLLNWGWVHANVFKKPEPAPAARK